MKYIVNGTVYTPTAVIPDGVVAIEGGTIQAVGLAEELEVPADAEAIDACNRDVVPGFIDIHFYGCGGHSLADLDSIPEELAAMSTLLPRWGTTSYLISVPVGDHPRLVWVLEVTAEAITAHEAGELLREPNVDEIEDYIQAAKGYIRIVTLAPNLPHSRLVARHLRQMGVLASLGHSSASYEEAVSALSEDFPLVTHVFNAMSGLHHRRPGMVGAILTSERAVGMLICDGIHVHPAAVKLLFRVLGPHRLILVTDAMPGAGLGDGIYRLLGQEVTVKEGKATLPDGTIAGSVLTMDRAVANMQAFTGCSLTEALKMATLNPAEALGLAHRKGCLAPGYDADIVFLDEQGQSQLTMVRGEIVWQV
jgi:N-acetylglucosamine-6-phosphate deacetylase